MNGALLRLLWLRLRGGARRQLRAVRTLRGALYLLLFVGVVALLINTAARPQTAGDGSAALRAQIALYLPYGLLASCLLTLFTSAGPAFHFSAAEVNWLLAGPFGRRALILYKLAGYAAGALLSSALIALVAPAGTLNRPALLFGTFFSMMLIQLLVAAFGLASPGPARRALALGGLALAALALAQVAGDGIRDALARLPDTAPGYLLLAPFRAVTEVFLAPAEPAPLLRRAAYAAAFIIALLTLLLAFGGRLVDRAVAAGQTRSERWARFKRSGRLWQTRRRETRSAAPPPALAGCGPLAWRQTLTALRSARGAVLFFVAAPLLLGPLALLVGDAVDPATKIGLSCFAAVFVLPRTLTFDFRGDREMIATLKTLPLSPWTVCAGQLAVPVVLSTVVALLALGSAALFAEGNVARLLLLLLPFALPFNLLLYQIENLLFLLFPNVLVPVGRADFDFLGRTLVETAVKFMLLGLAGALILFAGALASGLSGSVAIGFATAWAAAMLLALLMFAPLALALKRFDPARL